MEFWQAETFNISEIDKELGWAQSIGMNCMRIYLHHAAWQQDKSGFKNRMCNVLSVAKKHGMKILFVFFDDCWNDKYAIGRQPLPRPGVHNSGWLKDPGNIVQKGGPLLDTLQAYVSDILRTFKDDKRILMWDLYNEPGQFDQHDNSRPLMKEAFGWARKINPSQPLTSGVYDDNEKAIAKFQVENSDIITYHSYDKPDVHQRRIDSLNKVSGGRPLICTEYMARKRGSTFAAILPMLKKQNIGAINWGLVDGKTQTKYAWDEKDWGNKEPAIWFHDIFRKDGVPYDSKETDLIKSLTKNKK
ncbi:cellulase family glycosylhydrolase [Pedobacter sp. P26]|uniref:cellulase family glycosylhydrolase n=1 Tax=Pedobacter sp. P26 TaxID=3423956 RepID=UPI003D675911